MLNDVLEGPTDVAAAAFVKAGGVRMAIEGRARGKFIFVNDVVGSVPIDEFGIDVFAIGMVANGAFAGVAFEIERRE